MSSYMACLLSVSRPNDLADETEALARALRKTKSEAFAMRFVVTCRASTSLAGSG